MTQRDNRRRSAQSQDGFVPAQGQQRGSQTPRAIPSRERVQRRSSNSEINTSRGASRPSARSASAQPGHARVGAHQRQPQPQARGQVRAIDPRMYASQRQGARRPAAASPAYAGGASNSGQYSRYYTDYSGRQSGMSRRKKRLVVLLIVVLAAAVIGLGVFAYKEYQKSLLDNDLHGGLSRDELLAIDSELTGMTTFDEPFTVLLLGSDERSDDPTMGARTDTIVLVRIDPTINNITMLSIPRDTRIYIDDVGYEKFNAAFTYGGAKGTITAVKELCDVDIDHYAEINFEGLVGLIDAIGGIDVMVDETIDDPDAGDIVIPAGEQHLDGAAALVFSRSRAYADGDYTRVSNQRKVIEAIIRRGLEAPANELYGLIRQSASFLTTDSAMTIDFIFSLADQMRHNNDYPITITTATLPSTPQMISGVSYVIADKQGVKDIIKIFSEGGDIAKFMEEYESEGSGTVDTAGGSSGYSTGYGTGYGTGYDTGYSSGYGSGTGYDTGYGSGTGYDTGYGTGYGYDYSGTTTGYDSTYESTGTGSGYGSY